MSDSQKIHALQMLIGRFSFFLLFLIGGFGNTFSTYANNIFPNQDSLIAFVNRQLVEADNLKNQDLLEAFSITRELFENDQIQKNDSLINLVKYRHSLYLLLLDRNVESKEMIREILPYYEKLSTRKWSILNIRLGSLEMRMGNYDQAITHLEIALPYTREFNMPVNQGLIYIYLSDISRFKSDFSGAYKQAEIALRIFEKTDRIDWISAAWATLAYVCVLAKDYEGAEIYFKSIDIHKADVKNKIFLVKPTLYAGIMNFEQGNISETKEQLELGLSQISLLGHFNDLPIAYHYIGRISAQEGDYKKARTYFEEGIKIADQTHNFRQSYRGTLLLLDLEKTINPQKNNIKEIKEIYDWALEHEDYDLLKESSSLLVEHYTEKGKYKTALIYKDVYVKAFEKETAKEKLNEITLLKDKSTFEQEAQARRQNERSLTIELKANEREKNIMIIGFSILFLMLGLLFYYYNQKRQAYTFLHQTNQELTKAEKSLAIKNKELEKYIESNIQLEQFAHVASHDLRAPLITINSFSKLLKDSAGDKLDENEKSYLHYIQSNGEQMFDLVNDLLEYSKINSQKIRISDVCMQFLTESVIATLESQAQEATVNIRIPRPLPKIQADEIKIKRVFQNLISNAIKFSDSSKESTVDIFFEEDKDNWIFYVRDNGIGMKENDVDIFKPYVQLNRKEDYKGTGLGLSFCQKIIQQHGGEINYDSTWGEGSIFFFTISKHLQTTTLDV